MDDFSSFHATEESEFVDFDVVIVYANSPRRIMSLSFELNTPGISAIFSTFIISTCSYLDLRVL